MYKVQKGIIITCYRYSPRLADLNQLVYTEHLECIPAGAMHLHGAELEKFYTLAETRFEDIR